MPLPRGLLLPHLNLRLYMQGHSTLTYKYMLSADMYLGRRTCPYRCTFLIHTYTRIVYTYPKHVYLFFPVCTSVCGTEMRWWEELGV